MTQVQEKIEEEEFKPMPIEDFLAKMTFEIVKKLRPFQEKLFDEVIENETSITDQEFKELEDHVTWACKNWDQYWQIVRETEFKERQNDMLQICDLQYDYTEQLFEQFLDKMMDHLDCVEDQIEWLYHFGYYFESYKLFVHCQKRIQVYIEGIFVYKRQKKTLDEIAYAKLQEHFLKEIKQKIQDNLNILFNQEQASEGEFEHQIILKVINSVIKQSSQQHDGVKLVDQEKKGQKLRIWSGKDDDQNDIYKQIFEKPLLDNITETYQTQSETIQQTNNLIEFIDRVFEIFDKQRKRADNYYPNSKDQMRKTLRQLFINPENFKILLNTSNNNIESLFQNNEKINLMKLYKITYEDRQIVQEIAKNFENYTKNQINTIYMENQKEIQKKPLEIIPIIHKIYSDLFQMCRNHFSDDNQIIDYDIERQLDYTFRIFLDKPINKQDFSYILAKQCDIYLQQNKVDQNNIEMIIKLLRIIGDKDKFIKRYQVLLGERLLKSNNFNDQNEQLFLKEFEKDEGESYIINCKEMINDINISQDQQNWIEFLQQKNGNIDFKYNVKVLTRRSWLQEQISNFDIIPEFQKYIELYEEFYSQIHQTKSLVWNHGTGEINFKEHVLKVTQQQMICLLSMNKQNQIQFTDMQKLTKLKENDLKNALSGLTNSKIVLKSGDINSFQSQDILSINTDFESKERIISCVNNRVIKRENVDVNKEREMNLQIVVASTMKRHHEILIEDLINKVRQSKILKFDCQISDIRRTYEDGISRGWYSRDSNNEKKLIFKSNL